MSEIGFGPDIASAETDETSWRGELRAFSLEILGLLHAHPHVHPVLDTYVFVTPAAVRVSERAVAILERAGYRGDMLADVYNAWAGYVFGSACSNAARAAPQDRA